MKPNISDTFARNIPNTFAPLVTNEFLSVEDIILALQWGIIQEKDLPDGLVEQFPTPHPAEVEEKKDKRNNLEESNSDGPVEQFPTPHPAEVEEKKEQGENLEPHPENSSEQEDDIHSKDTLPKQFKCDIPNTFAPDCKNKFFNINQIITALQFGLIKVENLPDIALAQLRNTTFVKTPIAFKSHVDDEAYYKTKFKENRSTQKPTSENTSTGGYYSAKKNNFPDEIKAMLSISDDDDKDYNKTPIEYKSHKDDQSHYEAKAKENNCEREG